MTIVADTPATAIPTGTWTIDPVWSALEFEVRKLGLATVKGRVPGFTGTIRGGDSPAIEGVVDASTITTFDEIATGTCSLPTSSTRRFTRSSASRRPRSTSTATSSSSGATSPSRASRRRSSSTGSFVGAGVDPMGNDRIGIELEGTVDRPDFGLVWNVPLPGGDFLLPNEVTLKATFAAVRTA